MVLLNGQPIYLPNRSMFSFLFGSLRGHGRDSPVTPGQFLPWVTNFRVNFGCNICLRVSFKSEKFQSWCCRWSTFKFWEKPNTAYSLTNWISFSRCEWVSGLPVVRQWPRTGWFVPSTDRLHSSMQGPDDRRHLPGLLRLRVCSGGDEVHQNWR